MNKIWIWGLLVSNANRPMRLSSRPKEKTTVVQLVRASKFNHDAAANGPGKNAVKSLGRQSAFLIMLPGFSFP